MKEYLSKGIKFYLQKSNDKDYSVRKDIKDVIGEKEWINMITFSNYTTFYHFNMLNIMVGHNLILHRFFKGKKKIETRNKINEINLAKQDFMKSLNICEDIKRHIYSFL